MTSYRLKLDPKDRAGARFVAKVVKELQWAFSEEKVSNKLSQQAVADILGIDRSAVNRALKGRNLTLRTVGELVWALGRDFDFHTFPRASGIHSKASLKPAVSIVTSTSHSARLALSEPDPMVQTSAPIEALNEAV